MAKITHTISKFLLLAAISIPFVYASAGNKPNNAKLATAGKGTVQVDPIQQLNEQVLMQYIRVQNFSARQSQSVLGSLDIGKRSVELAKWRKLIELEHEVVSHSNVYQGIGQDLDKLLLAVDGASRNMRFAVVQKAMDKFVPIKKRLQDADEWFDAHIGFSTYKGIMVLTPEAIKNLK